jgi:hypothetical protein
MNEVMLSAGAVRGLQTSGHFALRLGAGNAADVTLVRAFEGGGIYADVISELDAGMHFAKKHLGLPKYDEFAVPVGMSMSQQLFDWIAGSWGSLPQKKDGAVLALDYNLNIKTERDFSGALVTETTIPELDAASNETGELTVRFQPEFIDVNVGAGKLSLSMAKQKVWRTSNFRLQITGIDCTKVSKIESFSVKREVTTFLSGSGSGSGDGPVLIAGVVEFPNLFITLSQASSQTWFDWHQSFVVNGNNGEGFELQGSLSFLASDLQTELSRIELHRLGIVRLDPLKTSGSQPARLRAELYCEEMALSPPGAV